MHTRRRTRVIPLVRASQREDAVERERIAEVRRRASEYGRRNDADEGIVGSSSDSWSPGTSAQRRSATRHGEHHRNARRPYAGHRDAATPCYAATPSPADPSHRRDAGADGASSNRRASSNVRHADDDGTGSSVPRHSGALSQPAGLKALCTGNNSSDLELPKTHFRQSICISCQNSGQSSVLCAV